MLTGASYSRSNEISRPFPAAMRRWRGVPERVERRVALPLAVVIPAVERVERRAVTVVEVVVEVRQEWWRPDLTWHRGHFI